MKIDSVLSRRLALGLLGALLLLALAWVGLRAGPFAPIRVTVQQVASASIEPGLFGIGTVEARRSYMIGPTAAGRVLRVVVDVGEMVQAGQLLAEMDPVDLDQRLAALDASIARARSARSAAQAQRVDARAKQQLAQVNAQRYVELGRQNFISAGVVEARLQEQASADAGLSAADANLAAAGADLERLIAERSALRQQGGNLRLLAPADALVVSRDAEPGSTVVAGQAVVKLVDPASLWVKVRFDQGRSSGLATGLPASIVLRSDPARPHAGLVSRVEAVSDSVTEERVAMVAFDRSPERGAGAISIGELAEVTLALPKTAAVPLVPNASIKRQGDRSGIWRIDDGQLAFAQVRTGEASLDGQVQILEGLRDGDTVVVFSERDLDAGSRVKVVGDLLGQSR